MHINCRQIEPFMCFEWLVCDDFHDLAIFRWFLRLFTAFGWFQRHFLFFIWFFFLYFSLCHLISMWFIHFHYYSRDFESHHLISKRNRGNFSLLLDKWVVFTLPHFYLKNNINTGSFDRLRKHVKSRILSSSSKNPNWRCTQSLNLVSISWVSNGIQIVCQFGR